MCQWCRVRTADRRLREWRETVERPRARREHRVGVSEVGVGQPEGPRVVQNGREVRGVVALVGGLLSIARA